MFYSNICIKSVFSWIESILATNCGGNNIISLSPTDDPSLLLPSLSKSPKSSLSATITCDIPFLYTSLNLCSIARISGLISIVVNIIGLSDLIRLASFLRQANSSYNPNPLIRSASSSSRRGSFSGSRIGSCDVIRIYTPSIP
jgi:hypothetical protein